MDPKYNLKFYFYFVTLYVGRVRIKGQVFHKLSLPVLQSFPPIKTVRLTLSEQVASIGKHLFSRTLFDSLRMLLWLKDSDETCSSSVSFLCTDFVTEFSLEDYGFDKKNAFQAFEYINQIFGLWIIRNAPISPLWMPLLTKGNVTKIKYVFVSCGQKTVMNCRQMTRSKSAGLFTSICIGSNQYPLTRFQELPVLRISRS